MIYGKEKLSLEVEEDYYNRIDVTIKTCYNNRRGDYYKKSSRSL